MATKKINNELNESLNALIVTFPMHCSIYFAKGKSSLRKFSLIMGKNEGEMNSYLIKKYSKVLCNSFRLDNC